MRVSLPKRSFVSELEVSLPKRSFVSELEVSLPKRSFVSELEDGLTADASCRTTGKPDRSTVRGVASSLPLKLPLAGAPHRAVSAREFARRWSAPLVGAA